MKNKRGFLRNLLILNAAALGGLHLVNRFVTKRAVADNLLKEESGHFYSWKYGRVFYRTFGKEGEPLLLVHSASEISSAYEWHKTIIELSKHFRVYVIDLPGCGRSDKPAVEYTNYFYVSFLTSFIENVIGEKTIVTANGLSASFALTSALVNPSLISKVVMVNPTQPDVLAQVPEAQNVLLRRLLCLPIVGECLYNMITSRSNIQYFFEERIFFNPFRFDKNTISICSESAHKGRGSGRFLRASIDGRLLNWNIGRAMQLTKPEVIALYSDGWSKQESSREQYLKLRPDMKVKVIEDCGRMPHMENAEAFCPALLELL